MEFRVLKLFIMSKIYAKKQKKAREIFFRGNHPAKAAPPPQWFPRRGNPIKKVPLRGI
jgi:hypothetical protein